MGDFFLSEHTADRTNEIPIYIRLIAHIFITMMFICQDIKGHVLCRVKVSGRCFQKYFSKNLCRHAKINRPLSYCESLQQADDHRIHINTESF